LTRRQYPFFWKEFRTRRRQDSAAGLFRIESSRQRAAVIKAEQGAAAENSRMPPVFLQPPVSERQKKAVLQISDVRAISLSPQAQGGFGRKNGLPCQFREK
jgi:hypothetical protein